MANGPEESVPFAVTRVCDSIATTQHSFCFLRTALKRDVSEVRLSLVVEGEKVSSTDECNRPGETTRQL